jgi:hypothetical protein
MELQVSPFSLKTYMYSLKGSIILAFSSNNSFLDLSNTLSLESFIHWNSNDEPNSNIKILKIALNIHLLANSSGADNQDYYHMASSRLKRLLPKLERIELNGGHCFYPENGVSNSNLLISL